jgi:hypothetical protein
MIHQRINDSGDHWAVSASGAIPSIHAPAVLVQLQEKGEQVRVAMTADQAETMARELLRRADEVRMAEVVMGEPSPIPVPEAIATAEAVQQARERGAQRLLAWTQDGSLLTVAALAEEWATTADNLDAAIAAGELFAVPIAGERYVPVGWSHVTEGEVRQVCRTQKDLPPTAQLVFWKRVHGSLGARTPVAAIGGGDIERVQQLAKHWGV